ncbi:MAG TPA: acetyl-CoA hydrolase/transferase C-terminal domain-containing protein [Thermoflexales bacterium]|nr:acetyl-CoA hydrolase/transferase C-terminal domain-containing protein [Thermoflexales bacterium]HQW36168.1 acetyl-CoA hydrolase/transferase C-terminal domain-containing protein [Thermoflexales bacterium]HQZ22243.1 acetyl-CoA hydrolase/transferase C-terminal domain-containing protein [Thermoflexales bacterium]HQZ99763.1 acetyl-CoA hydrolase/transferase C-terminal domain-containing protein [Thermoflexales bacterium]
MTYCNPSYRAEDAIAAVQSGMRVFVTGNCSFPTTLMTALVKRAPQLRDVEVLQVLTIGASDYASPDMQGHLRVNTLFISENVREAVNAGRADFTPCRLAEIPMLFRRGAIPLDVALIHVSPPDDHGFCSFGVEVGVSKAAAETARIVIAEVNPNMPRTLGDSFIHMSKIDYCVEVDYPLPEYENSESGPLYDKIGSIIAGMIHDGDCLQLGIGAIPNGVLPFLTGKRDLGIHSELFSDGVIDLVERGIINGERKNVHPGKIIAGFCLGTNKLYSWVNDNPMIELHPTEYVNDSLHVSQNNNMVAINSAIEVDLTGQVCADSIGPRLYSGIGGQLDFIRGAAHSKGGRPIIALPSFAALRDGRTVSRIVPMLKQGAGVTVPRYDIHYVVTEFGIADLYGKTLRQRAKLLIDIAHPNFREELAKAAHELKYA